MGEHNFELVTSNGSRKGAQMIQNGMNWAFEAIQMDPSNHRKFEAPVCFGWDDFIT